MKETNRNGRRDFQQAQLIRTAVTGGGPIVVGEHIARGYRVGFKSRLNPCNYSQSLTLPIIPIYQIHLYTKVAEIVIPRPDTQVAAIVRCRCALARSQSISSTPGTGGKSPGLGESC